MAYEPAETLAFDENLNRWSSFFSYVPEMMCTSINGFISFNHGCLWKHNDDNAPRSNYYGVQYPATLEVIFNDSPSNVKTYLAVSQESNNAWDCNPITTPNAKQLSSLLGNVGQVLALPTLNPPLQSDFELRESIWYAALLRDANTPNVDFPLLNGDILKDTTISVTLQTISPQEQNIFAVNVEYSLSERSNR